MKKIKHEVAAQRYPAKSERKNMLFPRNDRPYGLKCPAFQTEIALVYVPKTIFIVDKLLEVLDWLLVFQFRHSGSHCHLSSI